MKLNVTLATVKKAARYLLIGAATTFGLLAVSAFISHQTYAAESLTSTEAARLLTDTTYWFGSSSTGSEGFCTASKISPGMYITARHCAESLRNDFRLSSSREGYFSDVFIRSVLVSTSDKEDGSRWEDWAVLNGAHPEEDDDGKSLEVGCGDRVYVGMPVASMGYPEGLRKAYVQGYVSTMEKGTDRNDASFFVDIPVAPGSSGAPLISLETGHLIGIITEGVINHRTTEFYMTGVESIESTDSCKDWARSMKHWEDLETDHDLGEFIPEYPNGDTADGNPPEDHT